jgi:hypothetical protein
LFICDLLVRHCLRLRFVGDVDWCWLCLRCGVVLFDVGCDVSYLLRLLRSFMPTVRVDACWYLLRFLNIVQLMIIVGALLLLYWCLLVLHCCIIVVCCYSPLLLMMMVRCVVDVDDGDVILQYFTCCALLY